MFRHQVKKFKKTKNDIFSVFSANISSHRFPIYKWIPGEIKSVRRIFWRSFVKDEIMNYGFWISF